MLAGFKLRRFFYVLSAICMSLSSLEVWADDLWWHKLMPLHLRVAPGKLGPTTGHPDVTRHPMTQAQCLKRIEQQKIDYKDPKFEAQCGFAYMVPLYDPKSSTAAAAKICIDRFEFPNRPCHYPVVWVRANEAAEICHYQGKRLCNAHEWEGACAGQLLAPDYNWQIKGRHREETIKLRRRAHNIKVDKVWAYGPKRRQGICAMGSTKTKGCNGGSWRDCGSNTYPSGAFPECGSFFGVQDLHGNAAEHMNLPIDAGQLMRLGSQQSGYTEMKGSWFIFDSYKAHADHCRWRAPFWHGSAVKDKRSHRNYHLGFRCCVDIKPQK